MRIDPDLCVGCGNCVSVCPMGAISIAERGGRASVDQDECVECYACFNGMSTENLNPRVVRGVRRALGMFRLRFDPEPDVCPTSAIVPEQLEWPRIVRRAFSDVRASHKSTGIQGRGTAEVKTNDVTGRVVCGEVGFVIELGRPGVGVRFTDLEFLTRRLAAHGIRFESDNPVTQLMVSQETGELDPEVVGEKVMSAIVEFKVDESSVGSVLSLLQDVAGDLDTVMAAGLSVRCDDTGGSDLEAELAQLGFDVGRAKTNLGLGHLEPASATTGPARGAK